MYNSEYLVQVERAIQKLQNGERVVSIAYGDHVVRYAEVQINDLLNLRQRIKAELKVAGKRRIVFSTGNVKFIEKLKEMLYN
ncbi:gpW family head-tail joining protein [Candidatus Mesenet endosymbiont of Phosphuga atrata]|uniref:gpW family head-tail joining protein n=1 Tax=Candidatus Mesenet endosymbiont of Phosphuga atrata TaxID=3066221 RepID=UPI0030CC7E7A